MTRNGGQAAGRTSRSACHLRSILSHACAVAAGALFVLHLRLLPTSNCQQDESSALLSPSMRQALTMERIHYSNSSAKKPMRHTLLPIIVLEREPNLVDFQKLVLDSQPRIMLQPSPHTINNTSTATVGPFHVFYPSSQHERFQKWIKETATSILRNDSFIVFEQVHNTTSKRTVLMSMALWSRVHELADKALVLDPAAVLCGNPTTPLLAYTLYDWIGAAWKWASDASSAHHLGGNGALSIRSPQHLMELLQAETPPPDRPNEDMWFVRRLGEWAKKGDTRNGLAPPNLAPHAVQEQFAVEEMASPPHMTPVGVYHLMRTMDFSDRESLLRKCPEAKSLFNALHEPKCAVLQCPKNMSMETFEWEQLVREQKVDPCVDTCNILYHPVVNWTMEAAK